MLRFVTELGPGAAGGAGRLLGALSVIAVASMVVGNLAALLQTNVKRILAYSSIAHLGYLLVAILAGGSLAQQAVAYYLAAYFVTTLGAFGVVTVLSSAEREAETLDDYRGLLWSRPWLALILTASLLSLAGIPLTGGFLAKFYVFAAGVESSLWVLVVSMVINSAIALFYYLRIVVAMFAVPPAAAEGVPLAAATAATPGSGAGMVLLALTGLMVWLGVYPGPLLGLIGTTVSRLARP